MSKETEKKQYWQEMDGCDVYESKIGSYALSVDSKVVSSWLPKNKFVLDLPCGAGRFSRLAEKKGNTVVNADISQGMLLRNRSQGRDNLLIADAFRLGIKENSFDCIVCMRLLFHYKDQGKIISELSRVTRKGGYLICDSMNKFSLRHLLHILMESFRAKGKSLWFKSNAEFEKILVDSGYEIIALESKYFLPSRVYRFFPGFICSILDMFERMLPKSVKGVSFWHARRIR